MMTITMINDVVRTIVIIKTIIIFIIKDYDDDNDLARLLN